MQKKKRHPENQERLTGLDDRLEEEDGDFNSINKSDKSDK